MSRRLLLLFVALFSLILACTGGDDGGGEEVGTGLVILDGARLEAPFEVAVDGAEVSVNGTLAASFAAPEPVDEEPAYDETAANLSAFSLVDIARRAYADEGSDDAAREAAIAALEAHPSAPTVVYDAEAGELVVTDATGFTASLMLAEPADSAAREPSDDDREADAETLAARWRAHLEAGGGLVLSTAGSEFSVAPAGVEALVADTDAAFALGEAERREALLAIYEDEAIVEDLLAHYEPGASAAAPRTGALRLIGLITPRTPDAPSVVLQQGAAGANKTPGSPKAWVMWTLYATDSEPFINALVKEGYDVRTFNFYNPDRAQPNGAGLNAFKRTSGAGAVYFATHSSNRGISVQSFRREADASAAQAVVEAEFTAGNVYWWQEADGTWWLGVTPQGIRTHWRSNDSIVHSASCHSITIADAFNAREFFGYEPTTTCAIARPDTQRLWQRMNGEQENGTKRPASVAFGMGGFSAGFRHRDGSPDSDTVVTPSVVSAEPTAPLFVGAEAALLVGFDALMDANVPPSGVVSVAGCARIIDDPTWEFDSLVRATVRAETVGTATVTVDWTQARSPARLFLNGNQNPQSTNAVAENRDNYIYTFQCVASSVATPTSTSVTTTSTPTPTPTPTSTATPPVGGTAVATPTPTRTTTGGTSTPTSTPTESVDTGPDILVGGLTTGIDHPPFEQDYLNPGLSVLMTCGFVTGAPPGSSVVVEFNGVPAGSGSGEVTILLGSNGSFQQPFPIFSYAPFQWQVTTVILPDGSLVVDVVGANPVNYQISGNERSCP